MLNGHQNGTVTCPAGAAQGASANVDSYSAFIEADGTTKTGLGGNLREHGINDLYICGLATDFCVDCARCAQAWVRGGMTHVAPSDTQGSLAAAWGKMDRAGVNRIQSRDLA
jgi:nicotinamidase/pyrazinamidase